MLEGVQTLVNQIYPGVVLESPVQGWAYLQDYERGMDEYKKLRSPTAKDDRWVGECHFQLCDDFTASEQFYQSTDRGNEASKVDLALVTNFIGSPKELKSLLDDVEFSKLHLKDKALFYRTRSIYEQWNGNLHSALSYAAQSLNICQTATLRSRILTQMGWLQARAGFPELSDWFFDQALQKTSKLEKVKVVFQYAYILALLGRYENALYKLNSIEDQFIPNGFNAEKFYIMSNLYWHLFGIDYAFDPLEKSLQYALQSPNYYEEFRSRLLLVVFRGYQGQFSIAERHLGRVELLIRSKADDLAFTFRKALLNYWQSISNSEETRMTFQSVVAGYSKMGALHEQAWVRLHVADTYRQTGSPHLKEELDTVRSLCIKLNNHGFLEQEWALLPELRDIARQTHADIAGDPPLDLVIVPPGTPRVVPNLPSVTRSLPETSLNMAPLKLEFLNNSRVTVGTDTLELPLRQCELLALLALHPQGLSTEKLMLRLYGDGGTKSALKAHLSKLRQHVSVGSRPYRLEASLQTDFGRVRELILQGSVYKALNRYKGALLPNSDAPGIVEAREMLEEEVRQAVLASNDVGLLIDLGEKLGDDLEIWEAAAELLCEGDPRLAVVRARVKRVRVKWKGK